MNIYDRISPVPQKFSYIDGNELLLGIPGKANYRICTTFTENSILQKNAVNKLKDKLAKKLNVSADSADGDISILLTFGRAPADIKNPDQGYSIKAYGHTVTLTGYGDAGLYYAVTTLLQMLKVEAGRLALPSFELSDYPNLKTRGHFMETRFGTNLMELEDWKQLIDHMEEKKQNHLTVSVYGCWSVQYDRQVSEYMYVSVKKYPELQTPVYGKYYSPSKGEWVNFTRLPPMAEKDFLGQLIAYGKTKGIEVCPMVNSYGHNTLIPGKYPEVSAKDETGEPSLTGFCVSNPKTYEILFDIYDEIIDRYLIPNGINSFDIGLDEIGDSIATNAEDIFKVRSPWCKCPACTAKGREKMFIDHAIKLLCHLRDRGMTNIYMYHDMLIEKEWNSIGDNTSMMLDALREHDLLDVVCIDWWSYSDYKEYLMFQTTRPDLGIRRTVKPWNGYYHWSVLTNPINNSYLLGKIAYEESCEGMRSYSSWDASYDRNHMAQADFAWNFAGAGSVDDVRARYVRLNFPNRYTEAKRAFDLIDLSSYVDHKPGWEDLPASGRYHLLLGEMSYYPYSYVRRDMPYPRMFPGEAVCSVARNDEKMNEIKQMSALSREASEIFASLSKDADGNNRMAKRFQYEAANYYTLCDDFIALAEMDRLAKEFMKCKRACLKDKIQSAAKARKDARLALMILFEETKEEYLKASHLRNHSIFMQYFADLESYLANTACEDTVLDFADNTHFASEAFWALR